MDWHELAEEIARDNHDPADYDGREWSALTDSERADEILEAVLAMGERE